jgi:hypothetical protein
MWGFDEGAAGSGVLQAGQRLAKPGLSGFSSNSSEQTAQTLMGKAMEVHDNPGDQTSPRPLEILGARDRKPSPGEASVFSGSCSELRDRQDGNALEVTGGALDDVLDYMPTLAGCGKTVGTAISDSDTVPSNLRRHMIEAATDYGSRASKLANATPL